MPFLENLATVPLKEVKIDFLNVLNNHVSTDRRATIIFENLGVRPERKY
jgi:hypothetical protein